MITTTEKSAFPLARVYAYAIVFCLVTLPVVAIAGVGYVVIHFIMKFW
jgi:hypothetical protein